MMRRRMLTAAGGAWTPAAMFAGGEYGSWHEMATTETLWQDTSATSTVTAAGQSIARVDDRSGNGLHITQAVSAARPTYQEAGGIGRARFDGVDDVLISATLSAPLLIGGSAFLAVKPNNASAVTGGLAEQGQTTDNQRIVVYVDTRTSPNRLADYAPDASDRFLNLDAELATTNTIIGIVADSGTVSGYVNGVTQASTVSAAGAFSESRVIELGRQKAGFLYLSGDVMMAITLDRPMTADEISALTAYANNLMGV